MVKRSKENVLSIINIFDRTDDIRGNERPSPTPAPQMIAPIKRTSKINFSIVF